MIVEAAYGPLILRMSLNFTLLNADSGRYADALVSYTHFCRAYSKRVFRTNCALRIKKCAPRISSGIYFLKHKLGLINK